MAQFQKRINDICGLAQSGVPNVCIIWPADPEIAMHIVDGEPRARYGIYSYEYQCEKHSESGVVGVETITVDVCVQRFMVEEFDPPSNTYSHLFTIGHHDERCCEGAESIEGHLCYGLYREPEQGDLERLQQLNAAREECRYIVKSGEPMSYGEMEDWLSRIREWKQRAERAAKERYKEAIISGLTPQRARLFSSDPTVQRWNRWHFLSGHNKSGTPKNN